MSTNSCYILHDFFLLQNTLTLFLKSNLFRQCWETYVLFLANSLGTDRCLSMLLSRRSKKHAKVRVIWNNPVNPRWQRLQKMRDEPEQWEPEFPLLNSLKCGRGGKQEPPSPSSELAFHQLFTMCCNILMNCSVIRLKSSCFIPALRNAEEILHAIYWAQLTLRYWLKPNSNLKNRHYPEDQATIKIYPTLGAIRE